MRWLLLCALLCLTSRAYAVAPESVWNRLQELHATDPFLVMAIVKVESNFDERIRGQDGEYGLMQLKLDTARKLGFKGYQAQLLGWRTNLYYGTKYLEELIAKYPGEPLKAIAAFNAGDVYICKRGRNGCKRGKFTNQKYVDSVLRIYQTLLAED